MATYFPAPESALSIGQTVLGGTTDSILYIGTGPVLAQDNVNFNYHPATMVQTVAGGISSPSGTSILGKLGVNATITAAEVFAANLSNTIASAASAVWSGGHVRASTATVTGGTNITTAAGFNAIQIEIPVISAGTALTVTNAATMTILGAPSAAGAGPATITNAYALWVQAGAARFDGGFTGTTMTLTGAATTLDLTNTTSFGGGSVRFGSAQSLVYDAANALGLRNGTNAQTFSVYNTFTAGTPDYERLQLFWSTNIAIIRAGTSGTGTARVFRLDSPDATPAITIPSGGTSQGTIDLGGTATTSGLNSTGMVRISQPKTGLSGTHINALISGTFSDGGTNSTTVVNAVAIQSTINYTGATRTGKWEGIWINPTQTSQPTGPNAGIALSNTTSTSGCIPIRIHNVADATTNWEAMQFLWSSNVATIDVVKAGSGSQRAFNIAVGGNVTFITSTGFLNTIGLAGSSGATGSINSMGTGFFSTVSGTITMLNFSPSFRDQGTNSTTIAQCASFTPTINYTAATKTGKVYIAYLNPTNTSLPTGQSAALAYSSTASALGGEVWNNQSDEDTNYEKVKMGFVSNVFTINSLAAGSGTVRSITMQASSAGGWTINSSNILFPSTTQATNMTTGFLQIPGAAGPPSGAPATTTGNSLYYDQTNNKFYIYSGGAWKKGQVTAVDVIYA